MHDLYTEEDNFTFSNEAWMIPSATGTISALSSILIMSIILRSSKESRFSSYHIIMFFMSFWDTIASTAIALNTIPMPSDVDEVYPFKGKAFGNVGTCEAQGFLIILGTSFAIAANCCLNIYYLCTIRCGMSEFRMKTKVLPIMLILCSLFSLPSSLLSLSTDSINPDPFLNHCSVCSYPFFCESHGGNERECIRGEPSKSNGVFRRTGVALLGVFFFVLLLSLMLVVVAAFETEIKIQHMRRIQRRSRGLGLVIGLRSSRDYNPEDEFKETRALLLQACMYIVAFVLTWLWYIIFSIELSKNTNFVPDKKLMIARSIFRPLQGFSNAIIFIYHKAYCLCRANRRIHFTRAIFQVIVSPTIVPEMVISGIEITEDDRRGSSNIFFPLRVGSRELNVNAAQQLDTHSNNIDAISITTDSDIEDSPSPNSLEEDISSSSSSSANSEFLISGYLGNSRLASVAEEDEKDDNDDD